MKLLLNKKLTRQEREKAILFGLVELFLKEKTPISSQLLQKNGFEHLSSATIRNYFNKLEQMGYLQQQHSSGGRIPTHLAYREYANSNVDAVNLSKKEEDVFFQKLSKKDKKVNEYLKESAEFLAEVTDCTVFLSFPHFEQDFIQEIKLMMLGENKILCVVITDFGEIKTDILYNTFRKLNEKSLKEIEQFFLYQLGKGEEVFFSDKTAQKMAQALYNEVMVRQIIDSTKLSSLDIYKTGLSKLLSHEEFKEPAIFASCLSFLEDADNIKLILKECFKLRQLTFWIGNELGIFSEDFDNFSVIAIPYYINHTVAGAAAILSPTSINYKNFFKKLRSFSRHISNALTQSVYKYKIAHSKPTFSKERKIELGYSPSIIKN